MGGVGWRLVPFFAGNWRWEDGAESLKSGDNEKPRLRLSIIQTDLAAKERKERTAATDIALLRSFSGDACARTNPAIHLIHLFVFISISLYRQEGGK